MNEKESVCIAQSHAAHLASARRRLAELSLGIPFQGPLVGFTGDIAWKESHRERIKQIALLPVVLLVALFLAAVTPVMYLVHRCDLFQCRRAVVKEIRALKKEGPAVDVPDKKALEHLWAFHGLHGPEYSCDEQVELLNCWMITLYGNEIAKRYRLKEMLEEVAILQPEANKDDYTKAGSMHVHSALPLYGLLASLSEELPDYG